MAETARLGNELVVEIENRKNLGDKKFHSETSLQNFSGETDGPAFITTKDPGIMNEPVASPSLEEIPERRRTMSQPMPGAGALLTSNTNRRRRPPRSVMYAADIQNNDSSERLPKMFMTNRDDYYFTPSPSNGSPTNFFFPHNNYKNGDIKSLSSYRLNTQVGSGTPRKRSVTTMDAQSIRSVETQAPPSTSPEDNARLSTKYLCLILSCMYAVLLVTVGLIVYATEPFVDFNASPIYSMVLLVIGFLYQIYLLIDITKYKSNVLKNQKIKWIHNEKLQEFFRKQEEEGQAGSISERPGDSVRSKAIPPAVLIPVSHSYCFSSGRHSGSFYLKMGAAAFAVGHLIHSVLLITTQISYFFDNNISNEKCIDIMQVVLDFCQPIYCFLQLFFIFKYSNVLIIKGQNLAYFGFMHMIGSSLCFWISTIVREILLALTIYANSKYGNKTENGPMTGSEYQVTPHIDISDLYRPECQGSATISRIIENFSPYLYPFGVEFNILIVAVYYIIWSQIGKCPNEDSDNDSSIDDNTTICKIPTADEENDFTSNMVIYADCHASNKGMFLGLILTVVMAGMLILGFIFSTIDNEFLERGYLLSSCTKLALHSVLLVATVVAFSQTRKLDINEHPISLLDDILLFICLPAFFMETVFSMVATLSIVNIIRSIDVMVMVVQVVIQTALLVDGLRRCSNSRKLRRRKPAREMMMFLVIANVAVWLFNTFSYKSPDSLDERYEFYGKVLWSILGHISLPLIMFYRFHSSVCFADIWDAAYKPGSEH
ncbi:unnamed protein product [Danaus chrysippus]|uniref:(African queen) hypothetical protein n=1 Tax=Danaus chrysippus TaxID=151541 RepID=A0A8J2QIS3_9NEOP|nr:unnamed protein product [Danaus chrysippus]